MLLNLSKCAFEVNLENFLGFIVHLRRIDTNPEKVCAILEMHPPWSVKGMQ